MSQEQNPQAPTAQATPGEAGSLDAAVLALQQRAEVQPVEAEEASTETEAKGDDPNTDADNGTPEEDTDAQAEFSEVEFDGKRFAVPADQAEELQKALLRQADYSRKMNEVSSKEKAATQRMEEATRFAEAAEKHAEALAEVRLVDERLKSFERVDWQGLRSANPAEYAAMAADVQSLRMAKAQAEHKAASIGQEVDSAKQSGLVEKRTAMLKTLETSLKGWGDEMGAALTQYATGNGVAMETLSTLTDPGMVVALHKAKLYDDLQKAKNGVQDKLKLVPPVLKPGAVRPVNKHAEAMTRLSKTGGDEDAIAALASRRMR